MRNDWLVVVCWVTIAAVLPGCGNGRNTPKTAPVHGCVKLDGKPVDGAQVGFYCQQAGGRPATGKTDAEGRYLLSTFGVNDGAMLGHHTVVISKFVFDRNATGSTGMTSGNQDKFAPPSGMTNHISSEAKSALPWKYADVSQSGLTAEVKPEGGEVNFDLTSR
jgi:hypothetical protein